MKDGTTERENLESVERQTGRRLARLDGPPLPDEGEHVWRWFLELSTARGSSGFGPNPISYPDIAAWAALTGTLLRPGEVRAICMLDNVYMTDQSEQAAASSEARKRTN